MNTHKYPEKIKKIAMFTDIHWGKKSNSRTHNQDCLEFIDWFLLQIRDKDYTHIAFLGDWFESRSALNIETLDFSRRAICKLDQFGLPVFFIVGNHDLHRRTTRDIHSVKFFEELKNVTVIDTPIVIDNCLFSPFLFEEEYKQIIQYNDLYAWFGHFEFKDFIITGNSRVMDRGPSHTMFPGPKRIFSGHFHKRQQINNVHYIGSAFPYDFGDAGDYERGMATFYVEENKLTFTNWSDCPKYYKTKLSNVIDGTWKPQAKMKVKCIIDSEIGYQDAQDLREAMIADINLRDFVLEEDRASKQGLVEGDGVKVTDSMLDFTTIDDLVISQLEVAKSDKKLTVEPATLIEIYKSLKIEATEATEAEET